MLTVLPQPVKFVCLLLTARNLRSLALGMALIAYTVHIKFSKNRSTGSKGETETHTDFMNLFLFPQERG
jgi:hypothetical protein